jgi:hypothetical protein
MGLPATAASEARHRSAAAHQCFPRRTSGSPWRGTPITGRRAGLTSTGSNTRSSRTVRRRSSPLSRQVRHDLPVRGLDPAAQGHQEPGAPGDLRPGAGQCQYQPDRQPRQAALRQSGNPADDDAEPRPQILYRHPRGGSGRHRRGDATAARRDLGHAAGAVEDGARLRPRCGEEPRTGASWRSSAIARTTG